MKTGVIGTGYVGLVLGAGLSESGNHVICGDIDKGKIATLKAGGIPIYEPGLEDLVARNAAKGRLEFTTDIPRLVREAQVIFIAVGTPPDEDGSADLKHVLACARTIAGNMDGYRLVVVKSTVPVGTCDRVRTEVAAHTDHPFDVASNPEFLKEGDAVNDMMRPDRIVVGTATDKARELMSDVYAPFVRTDNPILFMDIRSSEMTKYAANAMLATRISFMNEIAALCDAMGADVDNVRRGVGSDPRIGRKFLFPGVGYGGSCFPKDVKALVATGRESGLAMRILEAVEAVNADQKRLLVDKVVGHFGEDLQGLRFAMWGLAFKPNTDDMREAPSIEIARGLCERGGEVIAYDPVAQEPAEEAMGNLHGLVFASDGYEAVAGADALLLVTEWGEFRQPDLQRLKQSMKQPVVFDGRNIFNGDRLKDLGFTYYGVGRT
ncbi:MAG: UDP-glucose/GDP-mannose dehydrogenase family protein [Deltaproteobacteria bacterium]|nr:UDP-glucose/GDP-mannose dehydrogenase family protein [Deltaproteobacteria bacterium]